MWEWWWSHVENDDLGNMETQGEILVDLSTFWRKLIDDLQKSDCYGLNGVQKKF